MVAARPSVPGLPAAAGQARAGCAVVPRPEWTAPDVPGSAAWHRILQPLQQRLVNPIVRLAWDLNIPIPGDALLETTGRRTGQPRRTPVCDGLDGETFWLVSQRGRGADWMRNIEAHPRVRIKVSGLRTTWRTGTAHILDGDDPRARLRILGRANLARKLCVRTSQAVSTSPLTVRIDLDPS
jgi:deazaflavin-dependent oxidoreductase (nitroreductase family)